MYNFLFVLLKVDYLEKGIDVYVGLKNFNKCCICAVIISFLEVF